MRSDENFLWIAPRNGQDWVDDELNSALEWLSTLIPENEWNRRLERATGLFESAKKDWAEGRRTPLFDPKDVIFWYIHQARCYGNPEVRLDFFEPEGYRIAPLFRRLGQLLPSLRLVEGAEDRAARIIRGEVNADDGLYELLVAGAYRLRGWRRVTFVPESKGLERSPDLYVQTGRRSWAVECKRTGRSGYARDERQAGLRMAAAVHELSRSAGRSLVMLVTFKSELTSLPDSYLAEKIAQFSSKERSRTWSDEGGSGLIAETKLEALHRVLRDDDIHFAGSRMIELVAAAYRHDVDYDMAGQWTPAPGRPLHAEWVDQLSLVAWKSESPVAARRKAKHFRSVVGRGSGQLPGDRPGVIHVGYETIGGNSSDGLRHIYNRIEMRDFDPEKSRLRFVYGNYFMPERVTNRNESAAVRETTAWYPIGKRGTKQPLKGHMLFMDEDGDPGMHF
ncbi:hypothetical protein GHK26_31335 [Sinorhizobium meliloti]|nr:hypothetical protein [Sinorhizobium meliloti]